MVLTTREAAEHLRLSETHLERLRQRGDGPAYIKIGRAVRYRESDLATWLDQHLMPTTSSQGDA